MLITRFPVISRRHLPLLSTSSRTVLRAFNRTIDNWGDATGTENISTVDGSEGITLPADANEAAIVLDLKPSNYSAILTSTETTEKEALAEAYEVVE